MKRIAIIGGGIAGLAAAYALEKRRRSGARLEYVLYESSPRLGGVISTERAGECLFEGGPDSFVSEKTWAADLCRELGLGEQLIASNDGERKTYIALSGKLIPMPDGLTFLVPTKILPVFSSPLFSMSTKLRIAREWYRPPSAAATDAPNAFAARGRRYTWPGIRATYTWRCRGSAGRERCNGARPNRAYKLSSPKAARRDSR